MLKNFTLIDTLTIAFFIENNCELALCIIMGYFLCKAVACALNSSMNYN